MVPLNTFPCRDHLFKHEMSNLKHRAFVSQGVSVTLGKLAECMSGCKTWSEVCKWNVKFQCPNTTEFFCVSPSWHWKWKMGESKAKNVSLCHRKSGSEMLSFGLASNQPFLDFFTSRNGWRTCLAHPSFSPALPPYIPVQKQLIWQTLWWQHSEWSTAQRACLSPLPGTAWSSCTGEVRFVIWQTVQMQV